MKKRALKSGKEIYHKLKWNGGIPLKRVSIGYLDREKGLQEMAFLRFRPGGSIPWSRVQYYKLDQETLWDRNQRIDRIMGSGETPPGQVLSFQQVETPGTPAEFKSVPFYQFQFADKSWSSGQPSAPTEQPHTLRVVSYNVLRTDLALPDEQHLRRIPQLIRELEHQGADLIALQEVTEPFREMLYRLPWVRSHYCMSLPDRPLPPGKLELLLMSRMVPEKALSLSFSSEKSAVGFRLRINDQPLTVVNLHLPSEMAPASKERSRIYLRQLNHALPSHESHLVLGDFNQTAPEVPVLQPRFRDVWKELREEEAGLTFDPSSNPLAAALAGQDARGARLDRILVSGPGSRFIPKDITLLGTYSDTPLSDHYGLKASLICDSSFRSLRQAPTTHKTALVVLPPPELWPDLQYLRRQFDPGFARWMPHFTLLYGFLPEALFSAAEVLLQQTLSEIAPFRVELEQFAQFDLPQSTVLWLKPELEGATALRRLQSEVLSLFPNCLEQERSTGFEPHLTVARVPGPNRWRAGQLRTTLQQGWTKMAFAVDSVYLISRKGDGPFEIQRRIWLGEGESAPLESWPGSFRWELEWLLGKKGRLGGNWVVQSRKNAENRLRDELRNWSNTTRVWALGLDGADIHLPDQALELLVTSRKEASSFAQWWEKSDLLEGPHETHDEWGLKYRGHFHQETLVIRYLYLPPEIDLKPASRFSNEEFQAFSETEQKLLSKSLEAAALRQEVGVHANLLTVVVTALLRWQRKHGWADGDGGLSPMAWTLIALAVQAEDSPRLWVWNCMEAMVRHDWKLPFGEGIAQENAGTAIQVWSLSVPASNETAHVDPEQFQRLISQMNEDLERHWDGETESFPEDYFA